MGRSAPQRPRRTRERLGGLGLAEHHHGMPRIDRQDRGAEGDVRHGVAEDRGDGQRVVVELLPQPQRAKADLNSLSAEGHEGVHLVGGGRLLRHRRAVLLR
jgi:hypothetical protein